MSRVPPLSKAIFDGDCEKIDALLDGRDVNLRTEGNQWNLLHLALADLTESPNPTVIRHLIKLGVDVNAKDRCEWTPLHFAVRTRGEKADPSLQTECVRLLVEAGADVNAEDNRGVTPLHRSIWTYPWNIEMIEVLLAAGAKRTEIFNRIMNAVAGPERDKVVELLAKYERTATPPAG